MQLYWVRLGDAAFMSVPEGMGWRLSCEMDEQGVYFLKLKIGNEEFIVDDSATYTSGRTELKAHHVAEYLNAVVVAVKETVFRNRPEALDIEEIMDRLLAEYWNRWQNQGLVNDD